MVAQTADPWSGFFWSDSLIESDDTLVYGPNDRLSVSIFLEFENFRKTKLADLKTEFSKMNGHLEMNYNLLFWPRPLSGPSPSRTMYFKSNRCSGSTISETVYFVIGCFYLYVFF